MSSLDVLSEGFRWLRVNIGGIDYAIKLLENTGANENGIQLILEAA
jgi:hypothetical protein